MQKSDKIQSDN